MKYMLISAAFVFLLLSGTACQQNRGQMNNDTTNNQAQDFPTAEAAAEKAKTDLLAIIRSGQSFNLGLDAEAIAKSKPATPIKQYQISFGQLEAADSASGFSNLRQVEQATVVPLVADNRIVTVAEVTKSEKGWRVASLTNKGLSDDLVAIGTGTGGEEITIYNLPHTAVKVYGVRRNNSEVFYTSYPGFSIREAVPASRLLPLLKSAAQDFQRQYGTELKNRKLVE